MYYRYSLALEIQLRSHPSQQKKQINVTSTTKSTPRPTLESTTPAIRNPGVTVELEPGGVSGGGREIRNKVKLLGYSYRCVVALQVYWYGNSTYTYTKLTFCGYTMKTIPKQVNFFRKFPPSVVTSYT